MSNNIWRNFINKPHLGNYVSSLAEIGYSHYGPSFALAGVLSAGNAVVLIYNICIEILNKDTRGSHFMDWFALRPTGHLMGNFSEIDLTMVSKFTVASNQKYDYNILFIDNGRFSQMKTLIQAIKDAWEESLIAAAKNKQPPSSQVVFAEFKKLKSTTDAAQRLKTIASWDPGEHLIRIRVTTENPKQVFDIKKSFVLTAEQAETLTGNAEKIIASICQQPQVSYNCVTPLLITKE